MRDFITGAQYLLRGFRLVRQPGLRRFVIIPLLVNTLLFAAVIVFGVQLIGQLIAELITGVPDWLQWLDWLLWLLFGGAAAIVVFFTFSILANLIGGPFNGLLAEAVEEHLTGRRPGAETGYLAMIGELIPTLYGELRKLLFFALRALPLLLLFLIPVINAAAPFIWILFGSWMLAIEYLDYPMGNHKIPFDDQRDLLRQRRALSFGFGGAVMAATVIPLVNFVAMPAAVAGATALYVERFRLPAAAGTAPDGGR